MGALSRISNKIKVLLLSLPENVYDVSHYYHLLSPYGLSLISSFLKQQGCNITLLDAAGHHMKREEIITYVKELNPKILGLTLITNHLPQTIPFLRDIKKVLPDVITVIGGPHPSVEYKSLMQNHKEVDIAVIGEGEYTMLEIINNLQHGESLENIKGVSYRVNGKIKINPFRELISNLDSLPFADWDSLPMDKYWYSWTVKKNYAGLSVSRGCPYSCTFCAYYTTLGKKFRKRSPQNIIEEVKLLYDKFNVRNIYFTDSTINVDNKWLNEICEGLLKLNRPLIWGCHVRADRLHKETIKLMKKSGCNRMFIGVESADNTVLKKMKKGETIEGIREGIMKLHEIGFYPDLGFILGMPGDTEESIMKTINFAKEFKKNLVVFTLAAPFPGTELYKIAREEGFKIDDWSKVDLYSIAYIPQGLTREKIEYYYNLAIKSIYLRFSFIINQLLRVRSWIDFRSKFRVAFRLFSTRLKTFKR